MPHDPPTIEEVMVARDATRVRAPQDENEGLRNARPAQVTRRSPLEAFQDDIRQATEGNPIFEALDFVAQNAGRFLGAEPGGGGRALFRFLGAPAQRVAKLKRAGIPEGEAFNRAVRSLEDIGPRPDKLSTVEDATHIDFKILDPRSQGRGGAQGHLVLDPKTPQSGREEILRIADMGPISPDVPTPGDRGMMEATVDALRQRPTIRRMFSNVRVGGARGATTFEDINKKLDNLRGARKEFPEMKRGIDKERARLHRKKEWLKRVNVPVSQGIRNRALRQRTREGSDPIMEAILGGQ